MNTELAYITKDQSLIRELLHPDALPGLGMSLIMAHIKTRLLCVCCSGYTHERTILYDENTGQ
jgi:hypothetical protein